MKKKSDSLTKTIVFGGKLSDRGENSKTKLIHETSYVSRFKITFSRMIELGSTDGCRACEDCSKTRPHTDICRARFQKMLNDESNVVQTTFVTEAAPTELANFLSHGTPRGG